MALWNIKVYGIVQGVGFRPFVSRLAASLGILGTVCNKGPYVEILAQGDEAGLAAFRDAILRRPPERAAVLKLDTRELAGPGQFTGFDIVESGREQGDIFVSPDIAVCESCKAELMDPGNRRYLHPFINCTACGPRLTILDAMPYDRERTSMGAFPMCEACAAEYGSPESRRYDAQPICCHGCGPEAYILDGEERGAAAIARARRVLADGGILAVKGIGGFHLACDASREESVRRLRALKHRPAKPFALMARDMAAVERECELEPWQRELLDGHQKPILLLRRKKGRTECTGAANGCPHGRAAEAVAPGSPRLGMMLPYAPIHLLLFDFPDGIHAPDLLVMTSGNPSGAPICRTEEEARESLSPLADAVLSHNRRIRLRADDSVVDALAGAPYMVRRSRGYAPLPVFLGHPLRGAVLAVGGELKNSFCLARNQLFYPSPYLGDLTDLRTVQALRESIRRMGKLLEIRPELVAADLHPRYHSRALAESLGLPVLHVQHHHAHVLSCMAENDRLDPVIGVAFDGTGYGEDGTIWGGEFLLADAKGFRRLGSIRPFLQPGGDRAAREGWRIALALLHAGQPSDACAVAERLGLAGERELGLILPMLDQGLNCAVSTSAGRLFDAVSAVLGLCRASTFEGEASMRLQYAAERGAGPFPPARLSFPLGTAADGRFLLPTDRLFALLLEGRLAGRPTEELAYAFHAGLARQILQGCREARARTGLSAVALTGGVFQNTLLAGLAIRLLEEDGFQALRHRLIPPNDNGLCLGQALAGMRSLKNE